MSDAVGECQLGVFTESSRALPRARLLATEGLIPETKQGHPANAFHGRKGNRLCLEYSTSKGTK